MDQTKSYPWYLQLIVVLGLCAMLFIISCHFDGSTIANYFSPGRFQLSVSFLEQYQTVEITYSGDIIIEERPPEGLTPFDILKDFPDESCPVLGAVSPFDLVTCSDKEKLYPGTWEFEITVIGDGSNIPGSPFTCQLAIVSGETRELRVLERGVGEAVCTAPEGGGALPPERVTDGQLVLYTFEEGSGATVSDSVNPPLHLTVGDTAAVSWVEGGLRINNPTIVNSGVPAAKIINGAQSTNELTIEAWVRPSNTTLTPPGPARIVTLSQNPFLRNFTLGQEGVNSSYDVRLRTQQTDNNGIPSLSTSAGSLTSNTTHVVYTYDQTTGVSRIYLNGTEQPNNANIGGDFSNWDPTFRLGLANEITMDREWLGIFYMLAIYNRALSNDEVLQNWLAGP